MVLARRDRLSVAFAVLSEDGKVKVCTVVIGTSRRLTLSWYPVTRRVQDGEFEVTTGKIASIRLHLEGYQLRLLNSLRQILLTL